MIHRHADADIELLQIFVQQSTTANKEAHFAAKVLTHFAEQNLVEQSDKWLQDVAPTLEVQVGVAIIQLCQLHTKVEELHSRSTLCTDTILDILLERLSQSRYAQDEVRFHLADIQWDILQSFQRCASHLYGSRSSTRRHHNIESHDVCKTVVQGQNDQRAPRLINIDQSTRLLYVCGIVTVCQHDTLWIGCSTTGVSDRSVVVVLNRVGYCQELLFCMFSQKLITHRDKF